MSLFTAVNPTIATTFMCGDPRMQTGSLNALIPQLTRMHLCWSQANRLKILKVREHQSTHLWLNVTAEKALKMFYLLMPSDSKNRECLPILHRRKIGTQAGIEPATFGLQAQRSTTWATEALCGRGSHWWMWFLVLVWTKKSHECNTV